MRLFCICFLKPRDFPCLFSPVKNWSSQVSYFYEHFSSKRLEQLKCCVGRFGFQDWRCSNFMGDSAENEGRPLYMSTCDVTYGEIRSYRSQGLKMLGRPRRYIYTFIHFLYTFYIPSIFPSFSIIFHPPAAFFKGFLHHQKRTSWDSQVLTTGWPVTPTRA